MPGRVKQFVDEYWPRLEAETSRFLVDPGAADDVRILVYSIRSGWRDIPLEEKQIPYLENEPEFWFAVYSLEHLTKEPRDDFVVAHGDEFEKSLRVSYEVLRKGSKLPQGYNARRPLP